MEVLEELPDATEEEIKTTEMFYISYLMSLGAPLVNGTTKSFGVVNHTPEALERMSEIQRNRKAEVNQKISNTLKGRKMSPEQYAKHMERVNSPEWKAKMSQVHKGKKLTDAQKQGVSKFHTGRIRPKETGDKIAAALLGKPKSPEHVLALSRGHKGISNGPMPQAQKDKISASNRRTKALKRAQSQLDTQPQEALV